MKSLYRYDEWKTYLQETDNFSLQQTLGKFFC